jgi:hypothetical protein
MVHSLSCGCFCGAVAVAAVTAASADSQVRTFSLPDAAVLHACTFTLLSLSQAELRYTCAASYSCLI